MTLSLAVSLLTACSGAPPPTDTGTPSAGWDTASPWTLHAPELDAAAVGARIDAVLGNGLPDSPALMASFDALSAVGGNGCGGGGRNMQYPMAGCQTESGWLIGGLIYYEQVETGSYTAQGDLFGVDPEGNRWIGAGDLVYTVRGDADWQFVVSGTWGYVHDAGWPGAQPSLSVTIDATPDGTTLEGGYMPAEDAVYFSGVGVAPDGTASGVVSLRDPLGDWYSLTLGPDGCGPVSWGSDELGQACASLGPAVDDLLLRAEDRQ